MRHLLPAISVKIETATDVPRRKKGLNKNGEESRSLVSSLMDMKKWKASA